jgi:hypothetical protein
MELPFQIDRFLADLIDRSHDSSIGLVAALQDNQIREFLSDVDRGVLDGASDD